MNIVLHNDSLSHFSKYVYNFEEKMIIYKIDIRVH